MDEINKQIARYRGQIEVLRTRANKLKGDIENVLEELFELGKTDNLYRAIQSLERKTAGAKEAVGFQAKKEE